MTHLSEKEEFFNFLEKSVDKVTHGTCMQQMEKYAELLLLKSKTMNLVAKSTLPHIWNRHFLDSAQLLKHIPAKTKKIVDLGSGAGFPAVVLSILGVPEVHVIESTGKKANFLSDVAKELNLNIIIHNKRIESVSGLKVDVVTARALTALPKLLSYTKPFMNEKTCAVFLKGEKAPTELTDAKKYWTFKHNIENSITSPTGRILIIKKLKVRIAHDKESRR